ncbi:MAG: hypothetical protein WD555_01520 [Fulvivirga sp.]
MRNILIAISLCLFICNAVIAQEDYPYYDKNWNDNSDQAEEIQGEELPIISKNPTTYNEPQGLQAAINIGLGIMGPEEINNYIRNDLNNQGVYLSQGSSDMTLAFLIGARLYYVITPKFKAKGILDYTIGLSSTEIISPGMPSEYINYTASRISIGAGANYYFGEKRITPYAGAAFLFHALRFEGFKGTCIAPRVEGGAAFNFSRKFKMEAFLQLDMAAEAEAKKLSQSMTIDFSSVNFGARFLLELK